jgi:DtxR family transcriptional regulator, Mn-dependent transcriptional regulator
MQAEGEAVRSARLAYWLGVSRPTVAVALRRMSRDGMVSVNGRKEIELTAAGAAAAAVIVRRHRIMERWLTDELGLDWVAADEEAARLEHAISDRVEERLYHALGNPRSCPHGNPIPGYSQVDPGEVRLSDLGRNREAVVSRISEVAEREAPALLGYLHDRGLVPGRLVRVEEVDEVGHTLGVRVGDRVVTISPDTGTRIWVVPSAGA